MEAAAYAVGWVTVGLRRRHRTVRRGAAKRRGRGRRRACARRTGQGRRVEDVAPYRTGGEETRPDKNESRHLMMEAAAYAVGWVTVGLRRRHRTVRRGAAKRRGRGRRRACARRTGQGRRVEDVAPYRTGGEETRPDKTKAASDDGGGFVFVFKKVAI